MKGKMQESGFIKILPEIFSFVKNLPVQSTEYFILLSSTFPPRVHCKSVRTAGSNLVLVELSDEQQQHTLFFLLYTCMYVYRGFPGGWLSGKESACQCRRCEFNPWVWKISFLEKEMATHSSILAWEIPWSERPGGLQSMGMQKNWT